MNHWPGKKTLDQQEEKMRRWSSWHNPVYVRLSSSSARWKQSIIIILEDSRVTYPDCSLLSPLLEHSVMEAATEGSHELLGQGQSLLISQESGEKLICGQWGAVFMQGTPHVLWRQHVNLPRVMVQTSATSISPPHFWSWGSTEMGDAEVPQYIAQQMVFWVFTKCSACPSLPQGRVPSYVCALLPRQMLLVQLWHAKVRNQSITHEVSGACSDSSAALWQLDPTPKQLSHHHLPSLASALAHQAQHTSICASRAVRGDLNAWTYGAKHVFLVLEHACLAALWTHIWALVAVQITALSWEEDAQCTWGYLVTLLFSADVLLSYAAASMC